MTISTMKNVTTPKPEPIGTADSETTAYFRALWKDVAPEYAKELTGSMGLVAQRTAAAIAQGAKGTRTASKSAAPKVTNVRPVTAVKTANGIAYEGFARVNGQQAIFSATCEPSFSGPRVKLAALTLLKRAARDLAQIEKELREVRTKIFAKDEDDPELMKERDRLTNELINHPDEVARREKLKAKRDQEFAFRTSQVYASASPEDEGAEGAEGAHEEGHEEGHEEDREEAGGAEMESIVEGFKAIKDVDPDMFVSFLSQAQKSERYSQDEAFAAAVDKCLAECTQDDPELQPHMLSAQRRVPRNPDHQSGNQDFHAGRPAPTKEELAHEEWNAKYQRQLMLLEEIIKQKSPNIGGSLLTERAAYLRQFIKEQLGQVTFTTFEEAKAAVDEAKSKAGRG